ncbi:DUF2860 family protein [Aeromonas diversa]|uniref:DUF2860 family protein n=1 Tax=Aeromonas diversa TaxID=502790 RepID=UPI0039A26254
MKHALVALAALSSQMVLADALTIPAESGVSGFVMGGVTAQQYESNFFKGEKGDSRVDSLTQSPDQHGSLKALIGADLRYTFADTRTQLFLGNLIQDAVRYDMTQQLGVRQQFGDLGIVSLGYVFSALPAETWADPYYLGGERQETDASTRGTRLAWDDIGSSHINAAYTWRRSKVDEERSGQQLVSQGRLTQSEANMLDRNGNLHRLELAYNWDLDAHQALLPTLIYERAALDGQAERSDTTRLQLTYSQRNSQWSVIGNAYGGWRNYDEANPIYGRKADANEWGLNGTVFWHRLFGVDKLSSFVSAAWNGSDSDIDFYDSDMLSLSTGLMYSL